MLSPAHPHVVARSVPPADGERPKSGLSGDRWILLTAIATLAVVLAWVPFLHTPLTSDESGFLLLGRHWSPGASLYGDHWVDRPPLLLWLFALAGQVAPIGLGTAGVTAPAVKLLGAAAGGLAVLFAGSLTAAVAPASGLVRRAAVVVPAALLASPLLGLPETDGELLSLPFVLLGLTCVAAERRRPWGGAALLLAVAAGASGMAAALVKQSAVDVFVFAGVLALATRGRIDRPVIRFVGIVGGAVGVLAAAVVGAASRGTPPGALWDAVVLFRFRASAVIEASASAATSDRVARLALAFLGSGAGVVLLIGVGSAMRTLIRSRRRARGSPGAQASALIPATLALAAWELFVVSSGGSYWLHYLTGLLPGLVLLVAMTGTSRGTQRMLAGCLIYVVAASLVAWMHAVATPVIPSTDARVASYLRDRARPADGVVVAFGHADIVAASGIDCPYPYLWSLPVRVRDSRLHVLRRTLSAPAAPRWVVVDGDSLASWGLDATSTQRYLQAHYVEQMRYGEWGIWRHRDGHDR